MLYSHRQATPAPLPHRIRFADGSTRTDRATFTPDELERAGYSGPYQRPECDYRTEKVDWDGEALEYVVRPYSFDELQTQHARIRQQRIQLLQSCDWTQITDYDLGADREAWATYRQALRDLADAPNPFDITWPQPPAPASPEP
jgi:hypothetical protein